jgi:anti-sigma regulatory factor (Ser/Thr protein kinase)
VTAQVVRRLRFPADHSSPGAARAAVRDVIADIGLTEVLDEALLLTTELATNAVVHARTALDLEIVADPDSITVTVVDFRTGPIVHNRTGTAPNGSTRPIEQLEERGRGLLLVDQLSTYWGTLHFPQGKGVWFRLDRVAAREAASAGATRTGRGAAAEPGPDPEPVTDRGRSTSDLVTAATVTLLADAHPGPAGHGTSAVSVEALQTFVSARQEHPGGAVANLGEQLLAPLCLAIGAAGGAVLLDERDGQGPQVLAAYGAAVPGRGAVRAPLLLARPWQGELVLTQPPAGYVHTLVDIIADRISLALENERLRRTDNQRRTWLTYLAEVSELLAQSLDVELTLALIPRLVVPRLGQWCAVHVADGPDQLRPAAAAHADEGAMPELQGLLADALPQLREARQVDGAVPLPAPINGYAVAMSARGQQLGVLSVGHSGTHRLEPEELAIIEDVARRAALAIDNARIHAERRRVAEALQRSLLPPALPQVKGIDFGAEYVPTGEGVDVGGDFYDVVALDDGQWLVVVGDVSGKGVHAATVTGLVREVTRTLVRDGRPLTCRCTWPDTTGRSCCAPTARPRWWASVVRRSACSRRCPRRWRSCRWPPATRWSSTPTG